VKTIKSKSRRARSRRNSNPSLFQKMTPTEIRKVRAIAYEAALAVIG
jgi:hypothetical protein